MGHSRLPLFAVPRLQIRVAQGRTPAHVESDALRTVLFNLPTKSTALKLVGLLINVAMVSMVADFLYRPLFDTHDDLIFTRVGAVYHDAAKIVVRYPGAEEGVRIVWKQVSGVAASLGATNDDWESGWTDGPLVSLSEETDWVGTTKIENLWTSTKYQYRLAAANATLLPYPAKPVPFKTFPDPRIPGTKFKFVASSCILPNFPYVPFLPSTRIKGFQLLSQHLDASKDSSSAPLTASISEAVEGAISSVSSLASSVVEAVTAPTSTPAVVSAIPTAVPEVLTAETSEEVETEFMILLGDFIYADVPRKPRDDKELFRSAYREVYASDDFRNVYERLPTFNIYDDHEISNDYNGYSNESTYIWANASSAWYTYQGQANYDSTVATKDANGNKPFYFDFSYGDVAFFVLDTRRYRSVTGVNVSEGDIETILGEKQMADLTKWVGKVNSTAAFKFIVSSVPLTGMWGGLNGQTDTWAGAKTHRGEFLELLEYVPNVVVISGDRHEFAAVEHLGANSIHEFSISPFSQFYVPFLRTFWESNASKRNVTTTMNVTNEDDVVETLEVSELVETEKILKYMPHGHYKWGSFEVDTTNASAPTVKLDLLIDGVKAWEYTIVGKPVEYTGSTALNPGAIAESVTEGVRNVLNRLGRIFG
ncbi:hypothetical protein DL93DRAFT_2060834 [Clavulina sp. PMI_390]|nr:hypothetical protein DL93DRAFT_2060834 [Clavulina sp. PMI_390]